MERKNVREETQTSSSKIMYDFFKSNYGTQKEITSLHIVLMQKACTYETTQILVAIYRCMLSRPILNGHLVKLYM